VIDLGRTCQVPTPFYTRSGGRGRTYARNTYTNHFGVLYLRARWYQPQTGRFFSPDPIIPDFQNPQSINRYLYALANPVGFTDSSGHDPLGPEWENEFRVNHPGCDPSDADRQARLYSVIFPAPVTGGRDWGPDPGPNWDYFHQNRVQLFIGDAPDRRTLSDFADQIQRLSEWYSPGEEEQFVWAIGLLYAGLPYGTEGLDVVRQMAGSGQWVRVPECEGIGNMRCLWLGHGMSDFSSEVARPQEENTHHYAGHLLGAYYAPARWIADALSAAREFAQGMNSVKISRPHICRTSHYIEFDPDFQDINMATVATAHGIGLAGGAIAPWDLAGRIRQDLSTPFLFLPLVPRD
jgi:RHS repeat-associated protein